MFIQGTAGNGTKEKLREYVLTNGCYSREENLQIYDKWFTNAPRYLFRSVDSKYGITKKE